MKKTNVNSKLSLNKETIANLNSIEQRNIDGGITIMFLCGSGNCITASPLGPCSGACPDTIVTRKSLCNFCYPTDGGCAIG